MSVRYNLPKDRVFFDFKGEAEARRASGIGGAVALAGALLLAFYGTGSEAVVALAVPGVVAAAALLISRSRGSAVLLTAWALVTMVAVPWFMLNALIPITTLTTIGSIGMIWYSIHGSRAVWYLTKPRVPATEPAPPPPADRPRPPSYLSSR